jgi:hypothetical protein
VNEWELELRPVRPNAELDPAGEAAPPSSELTTVLEAISRVEHAIERLGFRLEAIEATLGLRAPIEDRPLADAATRAMRRFTQTRGHRDSDAGEVTEEAAES